MVTAVNIPIELFGMLSAISLVVFGIGVAKKIGVVCVAGGLLLMTVGLLTDNLIMGKIPASSTLSGSTTTYTLVDNTFQFTYWHKILFVFMGAILAIVGVLISRL